MKKIILLIIMGSLFTGCVKHLFEGSKELAMEMRKVEKEMILKRKRDYQPIFLELNTQGHISYIGDIVCTNGGDIISASDDKTIRVWDAKTGKEKRKILGQISYGMNGHIITLALSPNDRYLAVGGRLGDKGNNLLGNIRIYEFKTGKLIQVLKEHIEPINDLSFSEDGKYLVSASDDKTAKIWNVNKNFFLENTITHTDRLQGIRIIKKNKKYFIVTVTSHEIALYNGNKKIKSSYFSKGVPLNNPLSSSNKHIALSSLDGKVLIFDYNLKLVNTINSDSIPSGINYNKDGNLLIVGAGEKPYNINIYDVRKGYKNIVKLKEHFIGQNYAVDFLDDQIVVTTGGFNHGIHLWNIKSSKLLHEIKSSGSPIWNIGIEKNIIGFSKESTNSYTQQINLKNFTINNLSSNASLKKIPTKIKDYSFIAKEKELQVWEKNNKILQFDGEGVLSYGWYKQYIILGLNSNSDENLAIYTKSGILVAKLIGHKGSITSLALDGDRLVSSSNDQTIKIWDLSSLENHEIILKVSKSDAFQIITTHIKKVRDVKLCIGKKGLFSVKPTIIYPALNIFINDDNEWVSWTSEGYFNASEKGMNYLYFHLNQGENKEAKAIPMKKLYDHFFRPDLIKLKLAGEEEAYTKAIGKLDYTKALNNPPPMVKIYRVAKETSKDKIKLSFNIDDEGGGVGLIRVYQEGKLIQTIGEGVVKRQSANIDTVLEQDKLNSVQKKKQEIHIASLRQDSDKSAFIPVTAYIPKTKVVTTTNRAGKYTIEVDLKSGKNEITIEAFNRHLAKLILKPSYLYQN